MILSLSPDHLQFSHAIGRLMLNSGYIMFNKDKEEEQVSLRKEARVKVKEDHGWNFYPPERL